MKPKHKAIIIVGAGLALLLIAIWYLHSVNIPILDPKGPVGQQERNLIILALSLSLIVVIPLYGLTIAFAWRYRATNKKAKYSPDLDGNRLVETIWWLIPSAIIAVLAVVAWNSSHQLDPFKPLDSANAPINVQVVALDWKWLFIYPQQNIASVNQVEFPVNTPVNFQITSDAPMNSFWIPQLGGQIYAMPGMSTQLHLLASSTGTFYGSSANISGEGFSGMNFYAKAVSGSAFNQWVESIEGAPSSLTQSTYNSLARPSFNNPVAYYSNVTYDIFGNIVLKYMTPGGQLGYSQ